MTTAHGDHGDGGWRQTTADVDGRRQLMAGERGRRGATDRMTTDETTMDETMTDEMMTYWMMMVETMLDEILTNHHKHPSRIS